MYFWMILVWYRVLKADKHLVFHCLLLPVSGSSRKPRPTRSCWLSRRIRKSDPRVSSLRCSDSLAKRLWILFVQVKVGLKKLRFKAMKWLGQFTVTGSTRNPRSGRTSRPSRSPRPRWFSWSPWWARNCWSPSEFSRRIQWLANTRKNTISSSSFS